MSRAIIFRNKAIWAEKYFERSKFAGADEPFEPEIQIKLEDEKFEIIKSEPADEDPNYEFMQNIDSMIENPEATSTSFVDVLATKSQRDYFDLDRKKKTKHADRLGLDEFGSSSGVVRCKLCMKTFTSVSSHQNHMKTIHREMSESEMHKCKYCNRYFKLKIYLNRHVTRIHGSKHKPKGRSDSKKKSSETIFNKEDVSLYCEVCWM